MTNSVCRNSITPLPDTATKVSTLFKFQRILKLSSAAAVAARSGSKAKVKSSRKRGHVSLEEDLNSLNELLKKWAFPNNPRRNYCYGDHDWECWVRFFGIQISLKWKLDQRCIMFLTINWNRFISLGFLVCYIIQNVYIDQILSVCLYLPGSCLMFAFMLMNLYYIDS